MAFLTAWEAKQSREAAERHRAVAEENRQLAEQRAEGLAVALTEAQANLIWSNLELSSDSLAPEEIDALWRVGTVNEAVRKAFLRQLGENRSSVLKFARNPAPLLRALGLRFSREDAQALLDPVLAALNGGADPNTMRNLANAARAIPAQPTAEQVRQANAHYPFGLHPNARPLRTAGLGQAAQALPLPLQGQQARQLTVERILQEFANTNDPYALRALALAVKALPFPLEHEESEAALGRIFAGFERTNDPYALQALASASQALRVTLTPEKAQPAVDVVLDVLANTDDPYALKALADAVRSLSRQLSDREKEVALTPVLAGFSRTSDPYALQALAEATQALPLQLTAEQAQTALGPIIEFASAEHRARGLAGAGAGGGASAPYLEPAQTAAMVGPILAAIKTAKRPQAVGPLVQAAKMLDPTVQIESVPGGLGLAKAGLAAARNSTEAIAWATTLDAILPREDSSIGPMIEALKYPTTALQTTHPMGSNPTSAEYYLLGELSTQSELRALRFTGLKDILAWVAEHHPEIDLAAPPVRPAAMDERNVATRKVEPVRRRLFCPKGRAAIGPEGFSSMFAKSDMSAAGYVRALDLPDAGPVFETARSVQVLDRPRGRGRRFTAGRIHRAGAARRAKHRSRQHSAGTAGRQQGGSQFIRRLSLVRQVCRGSPAHWLAATRGRVPNPGAE